MIPEGVVLSREGDAWIREEDMEDVALPLYEGRMIGQFDFSQKGWVRGKGRTAVWRDIPWHEKKIEPQYLMAADVYNEAIPNPCEAKLLHMNIGSATNERTAIGCSCFWESDRALRWSLLSLECRRGRRAHRHLQFFCL